MKILLTAVNSKYIHSNLAVYSLKAYHDAHSDRKDTVELAEYTINQLQEEIIKDIYKKQPDVLAFSCYIWNIELIHRMICELKKISAEKRKEALKTMYFAKLQNVPTSPRKMRLVADMIRGMEVNRALGVLKFSSKEAAARVEKLLRSAIANWEQKNERKAESGELFVTKIFVDGGATLKRMRPAPQGRGYRIRKRSNHVTLFVGSKSNNEDQN